MEYAKGTQFAIPIVLACYGMRRSELCALEPKDIEGDLVTIDKAKVQNERKEWIVKATKTTVSTRKIIIPMETADKIRDQGYVYKEHPGKITGFLSSVQKTGNSTFSDPQAPALLCIQDERNVHTRS